MSDAWKRYKENLGDSRPWDLINPNTEYLNDEDTGKRLDLCRSCDKYIKLTHQCKMCGCFMNLKAKLKNASCPLGKW